MRTLFVRSWFPVALILIVALMSGCNDKAHIAAKTAQQPISDQHATAETTAANNAIQPTVDSQPEQTVIAPTSTPPVNPNDKVSLASAESAADTKSDASSTEADSNETAKTNQTDANKEIQHGYTNSSPSLLGLSLNMSMDFVIERYGTPKDRFTMDDSSDPLTVFDYHDFLVGFTDSGLIKFIDLRSSKIDPGLHGLKLGQSVDDAFAALGKPDTNTNFVLTYKSNGALLKLDVDPTTRAINSIKLFADE